MRLSSRRRGRDRVGDQVGVRVVREPTLRKEQREARALTTRAALSSRKRGSRCLTSACPKLSASSRPRRRLDPPEACFGYRSNSARGDARLVVSRLQRPARALGDPLLGERGGAQCPRCAMVEASVRMSEADCSEGLQEGSTSETVTSASPAVECAEGRQGRQRCVVARRGPGALVARPRRGATIPGQPQPPLPACDGGGRKGPRLLPAR
jgi:hypothetical protein